MLQMRKSGYFSFLMREFKLLVQDHRDRGKQNKAENTEQSIWPTFPELVLAAPVLVCSGPFFHRPTPDTGSTFAVHCPPYAYNIY